MFISKSNFIAVVLTTCFAGVSLAQDCDTALEDALESFAQHNYGLIIETLTACPPERMLENPRKIIAYELLAQSYFTIGQADSARTSINNLLDLQPAYSPQPPQYSEQFVNLVDEIKKERTKKSGSILRNKWFWIGSAAATSVAAYLILNKSEPELLPEAPDPPGSQ